MTDLLARLSATLGDVYQIERELGGGGMSRVYVAEERALGRRVVVKVLPPELAVEVSVERFRREIHILAELTHPHIVPVLAAGTADGLLYYTMPFVDGESLRARLAREGQLPPDDALTIASEIADALEFAHQHNVVHRDIKPGNILLAGGHALVADFGIARAIASAVDASLTGTGLSPGTPAYMSPEQATGERELDGRSDVYSLGCVLYEMLAGEPPFTGSTPQAVIAKRLAGPPLSVGLLRPGVPRRVEDIVARALALVPADRFPTARRFAEALSTSGAEVKAARGAEGQEKVLLPSGLRRHRRRLALGAMVAAVATLGIGGAFVARSRHTPAPRRGSPAAAANAALDPKRVTVAAFRNQTGDPALAPLGQIAADWIAHGLVQTGLVDLIDARAALKEPPGAGTGPPDVRGLAEATRAGTVITGAYYREGDSLRFQAEVTDGTTGKLLRGIGPLGAPVAAPTGGIEAVRQRLMGSLAILLDSSFNAWSRTVAVVPTYEAYREFASGVDDYKQNPRQALLHFRRASALDPSFHQPQLWALMVYDFVIEFNTRSAREKAEMRRARDSTFSLLVAAREQLGPLDRAMLDWRIAHKRGDRLGALRSSREMARLWPDRWSTNAAVDAFRLHRPREAKEIMQRVDPEHGFMRGWAGYWGAVIGAEHILGEYREELRDARRGRSEDQDPTNDVFWLEMELRALVGLGRVQEAIALAAASDSLGLRHDADRWWPVSVWNALARELHAHRQPAAARQAAERGVAWAKRRPTRERATDERVRDSEVPGHLSVLCDALYLSERWNEARAVCEKLAAREPNHPDAVARLASLAARAGDLRAAERYAARLSEMKLSDWAAGFSPSPDAVAAQLGQIARARIAALTGRPAEAVRLLQEVTANFLLHASPMHVLHADPDFDSLRDYPPFVELVRPKG